MTVIERIEVMRAGRAAQRSGRPSTACPYKLAGAGDEPLRAAAWIRAYVLARRIDEPAN